MMDFQRITVYLTSVYCFLVVLPSINADCADRACFPPSPDLVSQESGRSVVANSTCGDPPDVALEKLTNTQVTCNSSDPDLARHVENLYDHNLLIAGSMYFRPVLRTWWQSQSGAENVILSLSLGDTFLFQATQLVFQSLRPNSLVIEKSEDHGLTWAPLRYYARSCSVSFPDVAFLAQDAFEENHNVVSGCMQRYYYGDAASFDLSNELQQVIYNPVSELGARFYQQDVLEFFRFTDLRINLVKPGSSDAGRDYFAVADWSVTGHCLCYGHAEKCIGQNEASCVCEHNTMGQHCDQCKPLYNNKPWSAAYMGHPNECEDCGCSGRTTSCTYNEVKGYGVCDNCTENSTGEKCDHCIEDFFINPGTGEADPFCIPCNCTAIGIVLGSVCNETQGQCVCKENVQGRRCHECKDSYYQLDRGNAQGCQMCDCDTRGTDGAPNFCDKLTGQCICKTNVEGIRCDLCKPGFFNLSLADPDGCTPCDCNGGGALSNTCNNLTGLCDCKMNIGGRSCDVVDSGFYVPLLDGIKIEAELVDTLQTASLLERPETAMPRSSGRGLLLVPAATSLTYPSMTVPRTQRYDIVVRYSTPSISSNNQLSLSAPGNTISYSCAGNGSILEPPQLTFDLSETTNLSAVSIGQACLAAGIVYKLNFTSGASLGSGLAIDAFVFLPVLADLSVYTESGNESLSIESCWEDAKVTDGVLRSEGNCSKVEFVVMAELYNGAIGCTCNVSGSSNSTSCDLLGGQCDCLPGVSGRECDYCSAYHYDFMPGVGCQACNCDPFGSQEQSCYLSGGVCDCKANVTGNRCDQCLPEHYGLNSGTGCAPCLCEPLYSLHNQCNQTGQCDCKPGVTGLSCSTCLTGFFNLTSEGCQECQCNPLGSRDGICGSDGQCDCLEAAVGLKCDTCPENTYSFGPYSERGCLDCICSGHSVNCSMATNWFTHTLSSSWSLLDFDLSPEWTGQTGSGDAALVNTRPILDVLNPRFVLELEGQDAEEDLFFVSPDVYRRDLRTAYGQVLHFVLSQTTVENQSRSLDGDVYLYGLYSQEPLVTGLPSNPGLEETPYSFKLHERYWRIGNMSGKQPDMVDMVRTLSALDQIKIRGKYTQLAENSVFLHEVRVTLASDDSALSSNPPAEFVEQCQCPDQYNGQFCESCMLGYRWQDPSMGPFSDCVSCDCNSHSLLPCDIGSGRCSNCTHNTAGDFCEICEDGFYGNATIGSSDDCQPCMCPGPAGVNSFAGTCDDQGECQGCSEGHGGLQCQFCLPGYYGVPTDPQNNGGRCSQCFCNLSPHDCNSTTGYCGNCTGNTSGPTCGECQFGYYGNIDNCIECNCNMTGSHGNCSDDGVCDCLPNVIGVKCTQCAPDSWGFESGLGCTSCECHPAGTVNGQTQCDLVTGQCQCKNSVSGLKCDMCQPGFWNVDAECIPCDCNKNGTDPTTCVDDLCSCDQVTGQCSCALLTIAGRTCDQCGRVNEASSEIAEVFVGPFPKCEPCPECFHRWRAVLNEHITSLDGISALLKGILSNYGNIPLQEVDAQLQTIQEELSSVQLALQEGLVQAGNLAALQNQYRKLFNEVISVNDSLAAVLTSEAALKESVQALGDFDGNVTLVDTADTVNAKQIREGSLQQKATLDDIFLQANASWVRIQQFYTTCVDASARTASLLSEADGLMTEVDRSAQQRRDTLDGLNDEQQLQEREQNDRRIDEIRGIHLSFDLETPVGDVSTAEGLAFTARNISNGTVSAAQREVDQTTELSSEAGAASTNTSRVQQLVAATQSKSQSYKMLALSVRTNATTAYSDMLDTLLGLNGTAQSAAEATSLAGSTLQYSVRPFRDMAAIVNMINASQLQGSEVNDFLQASTTQLETAESALNATSMAYHEAEAVQAHLRTIEYELGEGERITNQTQFDLESLIRDFSNTETIINEVQTKATEEVGRSSVLLDDISVLLQLSQTTEQCYRDNVMMGQIATEKTQNSYTRLEESDIVITTASARKEEFDSGLSLKSQEILQGALDVEQLAASINTTEQELINIQQQQNLDNLISQYQAQRIEMQRLLSNLNQMETSLDQILTNLDGTDGTSLQCNNN